MTANLGPKSSESLVFADLVKEKIVAKNCLLKTFIKKKEKKILKRNLHLQEIFEKYSSNGLTINHHRCKLNEKKKNP